MLKDVQADIGIQELSRKHGISNATFYKCRTKFAGMDISDIRQLENENRRLKQMLAEQALGADRLLSEKESAFSDHQVARNVSHPLADKMPARLESAGMVLAVADLLAYGRVLPIRESGHTTAL